jgi:NAD(P)-dependent dehydrogenase (short-subunit alcohol dehydrogenase family)
MTLLRAGLLRGATIVLCGDARPAVGRELERLGARCAPFDHGLDEEAAEAWARERAPLHALVYDAAGAFGQGSADGLLASFERGWVPIRATVNGAVIPGAEGGKIVLLTPAASAGPHAEAARSALENLARTLSVEWARHAITVTAIAPGAATSDDEVAGLVAFLLSPAGDYYSGCRYELGAVEVG